MPHKKPLLIVFGEDWGSHPSSTQHLVKRLMDRWEVLWINSIGLRRPTISAKDVKRLYNKLFSKSVQNQNTESTVALEHMVHPKILPLPGIDWADNVNRKLLSPKILAEKSLIDHEKCVLWISLPTAEQFIGTLGEDAVAYYAGDDFSALAGVDHDPIGAYEARLNDKADIIFAASEHLAKKFPDWKTHLVPHGADISLFSEPLPAAEDLPKNKTVGFYGSLSEWIDQELLVEAMAALPELTFLFIGRENCDLSKLKAMKNALFMGERPHNELARYSQHWDVSILPFVDNEQIRACNPLKLREYLAAGTAIVSTDFPALEPYRDLVHIAGTAGEFIKHLNHLTEDPDMRRTERQLRVCKETWEARADEVHNHLVSLL